MQLWDHQRLQPAPRVLDCRDYRPDVYAPLLTVDQEEVRQWTRLWLCAYQAHYGIDCVLSQLIVVRVADPSQLFQQILIAAHLIDDVRKRLVP